MGMGKFGATEQLDVDGCRTFCAGGRDDVVALVDRQGMVAESPGSGGRRAVDVDGWVRERFSRAGYGVCLVSEGLVSGLDGYTGVCRFRLPFAGVNVCSLNRYDGSCNADLRLLFSAVRGGGYR